MKDSEYIWNIVEIKDEAPNVKTFVLTMETPRPDFIAGQYLTIKLPGYDPVEGKSYSISSAPYEDRVTLSVRKMGAYSTEILNKQVSDSMITTAPYGFFYPEADDTGTLIFLAGGIGITPCISCIDQLSHDNDGRLIHLFYSNQTVADVVFHDRLTNLASQNKNFTYHSHITRQSEIPAPHHSGRINVTEVIEKIPKDSKPTFFVCGNMYFTRDLWRDLHAAGIPAENIYTEGFF